MKVLLTGASGFIGAQLLRRFQAVFGAGNVIAVASRAVAGCETILRAQCMSGNVPQNELESIEILVHCGAFTPKNAVEADFVSESNSNIVFSDRLLSMNWSQLRKIIYMSTLDVYAPGGEIFESSQVLPTTLYGWSKLYCERMMEEFAAQTKIQCQVLRVGHVYGPGEEKYQKLIPQTIKKILLRETVQLYGDGSDLRCYIYIDDVVDAIMNAIYLQDEVGPINIVGSSAASVSDVVNCLVKIGCRQTSLAFVEAGRPRRDYMFNADKMRKYLRPRETVLSEGLRAEFEYMEELGASNF